MTARSFNRLVPPRRGFTPAVRFSSGIRRDGNKAEIDRLSREPVDLLAISDEEMLDIRGDRIA